MNKILLYVVLASVAMTAKAETESYTVNDADGNLKPEYVANEIATEASVVTFSTANVEGKHVSGPVKNYTDGTTLPLAPELGNGWGAITKKSITSTPAATIYTVAGSGQCANLDKIYTKELLDSDNEPTGKYRAYWDAAYYNPDGTAGLPNNGTYLTFKAKTAGEMKVTVNLKGARAVVVVKASDAKALKFGTEMKVSGYYAGSLGKVTYSDDWKSKAEVSPADPTQPDEWEGYKINTGVKEFWGYLTWDAAADETYYVFSPNNGQIGFGGYEFSSDKSGIGAVVADGDADADGQLYNLYGQPVGADAKGILITGKGKKIIR